MILLAFLRRCVSRKEAVEREALRKAYRSVFISAAGQRVLDDLCTSVKLVQNAHSAHWDRADARAFAAGQQAVIMHILTRMEDTTHGGE